MQGYKYLEHTSDLYIQGEGRDVKEAMESVAQGLFNSISNFCKFGTHESMIFDEKGLDLQDLIVNVFTRILAEMDASGKVGCSIDVLELDEQNLTAKVKLHLCDSDAKLHIKAATFHDFKIERTHQKTKLSVLFDI